MTGRRARLTAAAIVVAAAVVAGSALIGIRATRSGHAATRARAAPPSACAPRLLADWADGRIDRSYPIRCYRSALRQLPADLQVYSSAPDDIAQALSERIVQGAATRRSARALRTPGG